LQRVALALCLGKPADVYLIDEPSAYLDSEQRLMAARVIKRYVRHMTAAAASHWLSFNWVLFSWMLFNWNASGLDAV